VLIQSLSHDFFSLSQFPPPCLYDWTSEGTKAKQILNGPLLLYCTNVFITRQFDAVFDARIGHAHGLEASTLNLDRWEGGGDGLLKVAAVKVRLEGRHRKPIINDHCVI